MVDIIKRQNATIVCDNPQCDYEETLDEDCNIATYVNKQCPKCQQILLTQDDYETSLKVENTVNTINKLFGWIPMLLGQKAEYGNPIRLHAKDEKLIISQEKSK